MNVDWIGVAFAVVCVVGLAAYLAAPRAIAYCVARYERHERIKAALDAGIAAVESLRRPSSPRSGS